jgi:hypothetical protein
MDSAFCKVVSHLDCQVCRGLGGCSEIVMGKYSKVQASSVHMITLHLLHHLHAHVHAEIRPCLLFLDVSNGEITKKLVLNRRF